MAFTSIKQALKNWSNTKRFKSFFQGQEAINVINQYFKEKKNWPLDIARASSLKQEKRIPKVKINKIFYTIG